MGRRRKLWSRGDQYHCWYGHFFSDPNQKRPRRLVIATYQQCPEEDETFLMSCWQAKKAELDKQEAGTKSIRFLQALKLWLDFIRRKKSPGTLMNYTQSTDRFKKSLKGKNPLLNDIGVKEIGAFESLLESQGSSLENQARHIRQIRSFFNWCYINDLMLKKPHIVPPITTKKEPRVFKPQELIAIKNRILGLLMEQPDRRKVFFLGQLRFLTFAMHTGWRGREIWNLLLDHISIEERCIYLREHKGWGIKGRREDKPIPINDYLLAYLKIDLAHRKPQERYFLDDGKGNKCYKTYRAIPDWIKRHAIAIGIPPGEIPKPAHGIRATVATLLDRGGVAPVTTQVTLRHKSFETTREYINTVGAPIREALNTLDYRKYIHNNTISGDNPINQDQVDPENQGYLLDLIKTARVVELVDTQDLGSCAAMRGGSKPEHGNEQDSDHSDLEDVE